MAHPARPAGVPVTPREGSPVSAPLRGFLQLWGRTLRKEKSTCLWLGVSGNLMIIADEFKPTLLTQIMGLEVPVLTQEPGNMLPRLAKGSLQTRLRSAS